MIWRRILGAALLLYALTHFLFEGGQPGLGAILIVPGVALLVWPGTRRPRRRSNGSAGDGFAIDAGPGHKSSGAFDSGGDGGGGGD